MKLQISVSEVNIIQYRPVLSIALIFLVFFIWTIDYKSFSAVQLCLQPIGTASSQLEQAGLENLQEINVFSMVFMVANHWPNKGIITIFQQPHLPLLPMVLQWFPIIANHWS